jgi:hypothetical protein
MAGTRLEYCTKWQQMASAQESNNQMAIGGSRRPTEKIAAQQLTGHASQKKNCGAAINGSCWPKKKCGTATGVSRWPKEKLRHVNQWIAPAKRKIVVRQSTDHAGQKKKSQRGNQGIAPASSKFAQGLGIVPNGWRKS